ncbi:MAG TPA: DUF6402 family protein [Paraburkholderia sp.]|jgi:hypothetical protein|uniref:DUF6402 family protein n=1 Tax=Paraburkholderia sp. TaxID=1926495 RepID=UPI002DE541C5|nr:DUF6402 family protein [Paraburkholderia sp.]
MSAQELSIFTPDNGEWRKQSGNVAAVRDAPENSPGVERDARYLVTDEKFEITEIPAAMSKMGWHKSAALLRKWFAYTPKNQAMDANQKADGFTKDFSSIYPADRVDTSSISLDWVESFPRTKQAFSKLGETLYLTTSRAQDELVRKVYPYREKRTLNALEACGGDIAKLHRNFQFQRLLVDTTALEKAEQFFSAMLHHGKPDDLAGALGGFGMYAAVAEANFRPGFFGGIDVEVTKVAIYVKNPYSFYDDATEAGSQYLGHWNRDGICLVPEGFVAQRAGWGSWSNYVIQPEGPYGRTFWPVHNSDFRRWQDVHNAGGDMVLYSDYRLVKLSPSIKIRVKK